MYKIFINNKPVVLTDKLPSAQPNQSPKELMVSYKSIKELQDVIIYVNSNREVESAYIYGKDADELFKDFTSLFLRINAAGGTVFNEFGELLMIQRQDRWDLPKGKVEKGESFEEAAVREVEEETGVRGVKLGDPILLQGERNVTYHTYLHPRKRKLVLKTIYWYKMYCDKQAVIPQAEEGITAVEWVVADKISECAAGSYGSIVDVVGMVN